MMPTIHSLDVALGVGSSFPVVADLGLEQVVAGGRRLGDRRRSSVCAKACRRFARTSQLSVAPEHAAADAHRRNARHIGAVGEGRAHEIGLGSRRPNMPVQTGSTSYLALEFAAAEDRVALRIDRLVQVAARPGSAGAGVAVAGIAGEIAEDEPGELACSSP